MAFRGLKRQTSAGTKKLTFKGFVVPSKPAVTQFDEARWSTLSAAVSSILDKTPFSQNNEAVYKLAERMSSQGMAPTMYQRLKEQLRAHQVRVTEQLLGEDTPNHVAALVHMDRAWQTLCEQTAFIRCLFMSFDRTYVLSSPELQSIWDMSLGLFKAHVLGSTSIHDRTVQGLLALIGRERAGDVIDRGMVKRLLRMLFELGMYPDSFETPFMHQSQEFYAEESARKIRDLEVPAYLTYVVDRLAEERHRMDSYLADGTRLTTVVVETECLTSKMEALLDKAVPVLVDGTRLDDLAKLYGLVARVNKLGDLRAVFAAHVKVSGALIVQDPQKDKEMVKELMVFKARMDSIVNGPFKTDSSFSHCMQESFEHFINKRHNKPAELIAKFIDSKLRASSKSTHDENELERELDAALVIFRYINGKDVFEAFYKKELARRLLLGRSASQDAERSMLAKLKQECGAAFTQKLEGMFKDVSLAEDLTRNFRSHVRAKDGEDLSIDMSVNVLTSSNWPSYTPVAITLPPEMTHIQDLFKDYYCLQHNSRVLQWQNSLGHCLVTARFPSGVKELNVSVFQTVCLLLFNTEDTMTFTEIAAATGIDPEELKRIMQSLACSKTRVLAKVPKGRNIDDTDKFGTNMAFSNPHKRVKINQIQHKETQEESTETREQVFQDRVYAVDAAVVRIMKMRKTLKHSLLISELFDQLKFPVTPSQLKKRIETLIERDFMERDADNSQIYHYVA